MQMMVITDPLNMFEQLDPKDRNDLKAIFRILEIIFLYDDAPENEHIMCYLCVYVSPLVHPPFQ